MLFHFLNVSQCGRGCGPKTLYNVTNLNVQSKRRYLILNNSFSRTATNSSLGLQSCFPLFVTSQIVNPAYWNSSCWLVGRTIGWALDVSKSKPSAGVFISLYFWWKPNCFQKMLCHFHFILHIISDKAAFVTGALFCVTGETSSSPATTVPPAGR